MSAQRYSVSASFARRVDSAVAAQWRLTNTPISLGILIPSSHADHWLGPRWHGLGVSHGWNHAQDRVTWKDGWWGPNGWRSRGETSGTNDL